MGKEKTRLDQYLFQKGLSRSRSHAQDLIKQGLVSVNGILALKPGLQVTDESVEVSESVLSQSVSRGAVKLSDALTEVGIESEGLVCLDIGVSTGGFSQVLLNDGAQRVVGIDVGSAQLSSIVMSHPRFEGFEGVNVLDWETDERFDLIVVDVSFISLTKVIPKLNKWLQRGGQVLALVKPQFEVGRQNLTKSGLVRDKNLYQDVENRIRECAAQHDLQSVHYFESSIEGGDGNKEFFIHFKSRCDS